MIPFNTELFLSIKLDNGSSDGTALYRMIEGPSGEDLRVSVQALELRKRIMASPAPYVPPGPSRDALDDIARAIGRAAAKHNFGPPTNPSHRTRGERE